LSAIPPVTAADPEAYGANLVSANLEALRALFPDAFTEGQIDFDVLRQLLGDAIDDGDDKYGLNWSGKRQARRLALTPSLGTLLPASEDSVDWDTTRNLMIEGDNLEVLKLLQKSYAGRVRLIYIDPPYNTGGDFVYADDYVDSLQNYKRQTGQVDDGGVRLTSNPESGGRYHTNWLSMMYPRLMMARGFLADDGVIMVSIDDHEIANLRELLDTVFGEENFVASLTWDKSRKNDAKLFSSGHEYMLVYAKSRGYLRDGKVLWRESKPGTREIWLEYLELRKRFGSDDGAVEMHLQEWFRSLAKANPAKKWSRYRRVDKFGPWRDRDISWPGGDGPRYDVIHPRTKLPCKIPEAGWRYSTSQEMQRQIRLGTVEFREDHTEPPFRKHHLRPLNEDFQEDAQEEPVADADEDQDELASQVRGTYIYKQSQVAVKALRSLLGSKVFDNPKDHEELASLFSYVTSGDQDYITLDFFAGSGSTGHAVMTQNATDGGTRRYILVQLPETLDPANKDQKLSARFCETIGKPLNIAEITKERLRRASAKLRAEGVGTGADWGFRAYRLAASNLKAWSPGGDLAADLLSAADNLSPGRTEDDLLVELLLKQGIDLTEPVATKVINGLTVHAFGGGVLVVCLGDVAAGGAETLAEGIAQWVLALKPVAATTAFFKDAGFQNDQTKTNVDAILRQRLGEQLLKVRSV
jgi:adenine-specific DNA-methyltransferase